MENLGATKRRQATLFLADAVEVERMRQTFNPVQASLIRAHITLLREDEVSDWSLVEARVRAVTPINLTMHFGPPERNGDSVLMRAIRQVSSSPEPTPFSNGLTAEACSAEIDNFHELRCKLLLNMQSQPRKHDAHLTIIHPRNGRCTESIFNTICAQLQPFSYTFRQIAMIEQVGDGAWRTLDIS